MTEVLPRGWLPPGLIALRERNFVLYVVGQFTSQFGNWIQMTAVSWIIYDMTHSPFLLGLNGLFRAVPTISLALFGGAIADRVPRRLLLLCTESTMLLSSVVMGVLAATGHLEYWHLYALNALSGTVQAFSVPSRHALFAGLVPRSSMQSAVTLNSIAVRGGAFLGPTVSGLALAFGSYALPFYLNAATFVAMLLALIMMKLPSQQANAGKTRPSLRHGMTEGVAFVWNSPLLKVALALELMSGLFGYNSAILTIIVRDILHAGPEGLGLLLSANGAGAMLGMALLVSFRVERHARLILTMGAIYTVLWSGFAFSRWLWLSLILSFALGTVDSMWGVTRNTVAQLLASDALRGRVMSVVMLVTRGSSQFGRVQSGFLVGLIGAPAAVLVGAGLIGGAILASTRVQLPKRIVRPLEADEGVVAAPSLTAQRRDAG
jgi:Transmembrane secretion effector